MKCRYRDKELGGLTRNVFPTPFLNTLKEHCLDQKAILEIDETNSTYKLVIGGSHIFVARNRSDTDEINRIIDDCCNKE